MRVVDRVGQLLVALAVGILVGHVCPLLFHAADRAVTTTEEDQTPGRADAAGHGISCDTAQALPVSTRTVVTTSGTAIPEGGVLRVRSANVCDVRAITAPPLFLLHGALLI
jgi:hypothetical protein